MLKEQQPSSSSFFLFSNPNPVIRSLNIPEPMIHPPGVDPYSFLNPKPNADDNLKTMAPLDVDPCAASRTEVKAITTPIDLTASEHAGGSFTESLMAPMASNSPANSETSPPQILNDVAETKIESKNAQIYHCDVCDVSCNSDEMFKEHKEGKKHLKKLQKLSVSSPIIQEMPPPVIDATLDPKSEKKKHDFIQDVQSVECLFTCNIPDLVFHDRNTITEHTQGEKQKPQVTIGPLDTSLSNTLVQSSNSGTEKVEDELKISKIFRCEVCKVNCSGERNLMRHKIGKKHLKNLKVSENKQTPPLTTSTASMATTPVSKPVEKVCDSEEVKSRCFKKNAEGKMRRMKLTETENITVFPLTRNDRVILQPNDIVENPKLTKGEVVNPNEGSSTRCELCGICCNSYDELNKHLSGKKHKKAVHKTEKLNGHGTERMLQDMMNGEGKVVILEMGKRKANDSLASEEDVDVKRKKIMKEEGNFGASISCQVCNVACTSLVAFSDHLATKEHSAMVLKQV